MRDRQAAAVALLQRGPDGSVRAPPGEQEDLRVLRTVHFQVRNLPNDALHLRRAQVHHEIVVLGVVRDVSLDVRLLQPPDPVLHGRSSRHDPRAREGHIVSEVRLKPLRIGPELDVHLREVLDLRNPPRLRAVRKIPVRQDKDRDHVVRGDAHRVERDVEAVGGRAGRQDAGRRIGVAPEHRLEKVGLLRLGRKTGGRSSALDVADHQRQLDHDRQPDRFALQRDARAASSGDGD